MEVLPPPYAELETVVGPGWLGARVMAPEGGLVTIGIRLDFTARPPAPSGTRLDPAEAEHYTRPSEGLIKVSARVGGLAARLAGDGRGPLAVVRRFWT